MTDKTIVITRPMGDEATLTEHLQMRGHRIIHEPLTHITLDHTQRVAVANALMQDPNAVIVTSRHGVEALATLTELRDIFLICVGDATAKRAQAHGFERITSGGGNVENMLEIITQAYDDEARFLYISGKHTKVDLGEALMQYGMSVEQIITYEALATEQLSEILIEHIKREQIDAISFLSQRAASIFTRLLDSDEAKQALKHIEAFCISDAVSETLETQRWKKIYTAQEPTLASMIECIDNAYGGSDDG